MKKLIQTWNTISNIGIDDKVSYMDKVKVRALNQGVGIVILLQSIIFFHYVYFLQIEGMFVGIGVLTFLFSLWVLNKYQYFNLAQTFLNTIFPLGMLLIGIVYGSNSGMQYNLMIFAVTAFFFHEKLITKLILVIYNILIFFILDFYWEYYTSPYAYVTSPFIEPLAFIIAIIAITTIVHTFMTEIGKFHNTNKGLVTSLEENNTELKTANQALERFAYIASHDLKTPLRTILGFTELLERDYNNKKMNNFSTYFTQIKQGAKQMNELIKNTLEYSRINHGLEEKKSIDLNKIIQNIQRTYVIDANIKITTVLLPIIHAEENQILSLFQNLIENGLKYNDEVQKIITIDYKETAYSHIITIKDNGIGIPPKFHEQIFTMFKRLHTNQKYEGTGLGLAICEKIVDKMKGQISLTSLVGKGTTFYIALPK